MSAPDPKPPVSARRPVTSTLHGTVRSDDYAWLKDPDWQRVMREPDALDPDIRAYLEAENACTEAFLAPFAALREALYAEMRGRMKEDESSVPAPDGDWAYYVRFVEGGEHPLYCRTPRTGEAAEELLLDGNREAEGSHISGSAPAGTAPITAALPTRSTSTVRSATGSSSAISRAAPLSTGPSRMPVAMPSGLPTARPCSTP